MVSIIFILHTIDHSSELEFLGVHQGFVIWHFGMFLAFVNTLSEMVEFALEVGL